jgi:hypothetical protein
VCPRTAVSRAVHLIGPRVARAQSDLWAQGLTLRAYSGPCVFDLSRVTHVSPMFAARLTASCDLQAAARLIPPLSIDAAASLRLLMGSEVATAGTVLLPCTRISHVEFVERVGERLADGLHPTFDAQRLACTLMLCFSELCANALPSDGASSAYVAADRHGERLRLAVGDLGVGIPAAQRLRDRSLVGDREALIAAFTRPVAEQATPLRGCSGILHHLRSLPGSATFRVWSGAARLTLSFREGRLLTRCATLAPASTPGTWVQVEIAAPDSKG